jgi:hypothetical protein
MIARTPLALMALLTVLACGCASAEPVPSPKSPAPGPAPAPPPTALELLLRQRDALELTFGQERKLKALGEELTRTNAPLERELASLETHAPPAESGEEGLRPAGGPPGGGGMRMGRGGGGRGGGMGGGRGGGMGGGRRGGGSGPRAGGGEGHTEDRAHAQSGRAEALRAQMAANHAAALREAMQVLDEGQRHRALELLDENDFELPAQPTRPADPTHVDDQDRR